jgi:hypothetical protein
MEVVEARVRPVAVPAVVVAGAEDHMAEVAEVAEAVAVVATPTAEAVRT